MRMLNQNDDINVKEFARSINIKDAVILSDKCWNEVKPDTIVKCWRRVLDTSPSEQSTSTEDSISPLPAVQSLLDKCDLSPTDKENWLTADDNDCGNRDLTDEEIISRVNDGDDITVDDEDNEDEESTQTITHAQACAALETVVKDLEQEPDIPMNTTIIVNRLLITTASKRAMSLKQRKITDYFSNS